MTSLLKRLAKSFRQIGGGAPCQADFLSTSGAAAAWWDEILMASIYDETARMYLDFLGPRR